MENQEQETLAAAPNPPLPSLPPLSGSYKSRKFILVIWGTILAMVCGILAAKWPAFSANLITMLSTLTGMLTLYFGANLTDAHLQNKVNKDDQ